tara:strand:+ start:194 stop:376 length:183 start_codon:yes stop_codon:yes gene_type:complete
MANLYIVDGYEIVEKTLEEFCSDFNDQDGYASASSGPVYIYLTLEEAEEKLEEAEDNESI